MPVRYSSNTTIRVRWDERRHVYVGSVSDGRHRWRGTVYLNWWRIGGPKGSSAYDQAARDLLREALKRYPRLSVEKDAFGRPEVSRVFECPCPGHEPLPHRRRTR